MVRLVKSVTRAVEILELFEKERRPLTAADIVKKLDHPVASTHEILKTLVELGYFSFGAPKWAYMPSMRFVSNLNWVDAYYNDELHLHNFMAALNRKTKETINLSRVDGKNAVIIKGMECLHEFGVSSKPGSKMLLTGSITGLTYLASLSHANREALLETLAIDDPKQIESLNRKALTTIISDLERDGVVMRSDIAIEGIGALCFPVTSMSTSEVFILGVVGPSARIIDNAKGHAKIINDLISKYGISVKV